MISDFLRVMLLALVGVFLFACGNEESPGIDLGPTITEFQTVDATTGSIAASPTPVPTATSVSLPRTSATLQSALLSLADLPSGWSEDVDEDDDTGSDFCREDGSTNVAPATARAEAGFKQSDYGPFLGHLLAGYDDAETAKRVVEAFREVAESCKEWTKAENGTTYTYRLSKMSFDKVGDDSSAYRLSISGVPIFGSGQTDLVIWRESNVVSLVAMTAIGPSAATLGDVLSGFVETADDKLSDLR